MGDTEGEDYGREVVAEAVVNGRRETVQGEVVGGKGAFVDEQGGARENHR